MWSTIARNATARITSRCRADRFSTGFGMMCGYRFPRIHAASCRLRARCALTRSASNCSSSPQQQDTRLFQHLFSSRSRC
ncbi:hypothetical protein KCP76_26085 (plasmid) [Salmonella enterica subsp. enterica serovar Weltevreden]|nr:hypothetical protein KCP76_26085 [Salmonella enterica subsp. enterica serovar Weltevreden]